MGLHAGMSLADARAIVPALRTRTATPEADAAALRRLAHWCTRFTPWTNVDGTDGLWLDISGCAHLFGGEEALLAEIARRLRGLGLTCRLGLAETPGAAWAMARFGPGSAPADGRIAPGGIEAALARLPVQSLRLAPETAALLERFGLARVGALYAIPRPALARRFSASAQGEALLTRLDQTLGRVSEPIAPLQPAPAYRTRRAFPEPVLSGDVIENVAVQLIDDLTAVLARDHQGARRLTLQAFRVDGTCASIGIALARPSRNRGHMARLLQEKRDCLDPGFGIDLVILNATGTEPLAPQQMSLVGQSVEPGDEAALAELIDRLANRFGPQNIVCAGVRQSHWPERAAVWHGPARAVATKTPAPAAPVHVLPGSRPFLLFTRPEPVLVLAEIPDGPPLSFTWRRVKRPVVRAEGPERITPEWWRPGGPEDGIVRDYYRIEDACGRRYWLFRAGLYGDAEHPRPRWYIHGLFA